MPTEWGGYATFEEDNSPPTWVSWVLAVACGVVVTGFVLAAYSFVHQRWPAFAAFVVVAAFASGAALAMMDRAAPREVIVDGDQGAAGEAAGGSAPRRDGGR